MLKGPGTILIIDDNYSFVLLLLRYFSDHLNIQFNVLLPSKKESNYIIYSKPIRRICSEWSSVEICELFLKGTVIC